jgi:hypothetical protein
LLNDKAGPQRLPEACRASFGNLVRPTSIIEAEKADSPSPFAVAFPINKRARHIYLKISELIQGILPLLFREALIIPVIIKQFVD